ncbi:MAG: transcription antitermination factor NusB [Planctomycetota bacterium]
MKPDRHQARILAMQALCQLDVQGEGAFADTEAFLAEGDRCVQDRDSSVPHKSPERTGVNERTCPLPQADEDTRRYARTLVESAWERRDRFRERIQTAGSAWDIERMDLVDRNVIRVALAELSLGEVPPKVVLNEAIEIAREFGSAESPGFVNGVLDHVYQCMRKETENGKWKMENGE